VFISSFRPKNLSVRSFTSPALSLYLDCRSAVPIVCSFSGVLTSSVVSFMWAFFILSQGYGFFRRLRSNFRFSRFCNSLETGVLFPQNFLDPFAFGEITRLFFITKTFCPRDHLCEVKGFQPDFFTFGIPFHSFPEVIESRFPGLPSITLFMIFSSFPINLFGPFFDPIFLF